MNHPNGTWYNLFTLRYSTGSRVILYFFREPNGLLCLFFFAHLKKQSIHFPLDGRRDFYIETVKVQGIVFNKTEEGKSLSSEERLQRSLQRDLRDVAGSKTSKIFKN